MAFIYLKDLKLVGSDENLINFSNNAQKEIQDIISKSWNKVYAIELVSTFINQ
jgi:hypothetical protein